MIHPRERGEWDEDQWLDYIDYSYLEQPDEHDPYENEPETDDDRY